MNKLPLIAVGALAFVVIITLVFAAQQRAKKNQTTAAPQQDRIAEARDTKAGYQALVQGYEDGVIPAAMAEAPSTPKVQPTREAPPPAAPAAAPAVPPGDAAPPSQSMDLTKEEKERIKRARQFREDMFYDAVVSNTSVRMPDGGQEEERQGSSPVPGALGAEGMEAERQRRMERALQLSRAAAGGGGVGSGGMTLAGLDGDSADPNLRARKDEFQQTERRYGYSSEMRRPQLTPFELRVGSVIPAVMVGGINSDLPGEIIAQVSQNVRDTRSGQHILIPQGAKLIGSYDSHVAMGQSRVMVAWHRLQFPDGSTMELGNMGGTDQAGYAGFKDKVNNHYWRIFGNATLLSLISAGAQLSQPEDNNDSETSPNEQLAAELGRQWGQVGQQMTRRNMQIQPTLEIRPGYRFNVMVNKDLILVPYEPWPTGEGL